MTGGRRAVLVEPGSPVEVWDLPVPHAGPGEVLLSVHTAGVCGTDVHMINGEVPLPGPIVLGHEGVGVVAELGEGVATDHAGAQIQPGDRVLWIPLLPCHRCYQCTVAQDVTQCPSLLTPLFRDGAAPPTGSYAESVLIPSAMPFYRIPNDTPVDAVIAFGCAMPTVLQGFERVGRSVFGQDVVIQGSGPVGLAATLVARLSGANQIIVIEAAPRRLEMAERFGATSRISMSEIPDAVDRSHAVLELTEGRGADLVVEAAGVLPAFGEGLSLTAANGTYLVAGLWSAPGRVPIEPRLVNNLNKRIVGTNAASPRQQYQAIRLAQRFHRDVPIAEAVTDVFSLDDVDKALDAVRAGQTVKAVIRPNVNP